MYLNTVLRSSDFLPPVITHLPLTKINNVILLLFEYCLYINPGNISGSYCTNLEWASCFCRSSNLIGFLKSKLATIFYTVKSLNCTGKPNLYIILAYFLAATKLSSSDLAPVHTIFPDWKTRAVVFGSLKRIMTAENLLGSIY